MNFFNDQIKREKDKSLRRPRPRRRLKEKLEWILMIHENVRYGMDSP